MDLRQLTIFRAVAKHLNFTRAAASLNYVQSNVTAQIQALEEELGVPLFDRLGKQVALTVAGHQLLAYAERLLELAEEAQSVVSLGIEPQGTLKIGATETFCIYRLPALLRAFRRQYPRVHLIFRPSRATELRQLVREGVIDVAFTLEEMDRDSGPADEPLAMEPVWLLAAPDHPLVGKSEVTPADLTGVDLLLIDSKCGYRAMFERILDKAGVSPATTMEFGSIEAVKQCVMIGLGLTVLPSYAVAAEVAQGRLCQLPWVGSKLDVMIHVMWHKDKWLSPALNAFLVLTRSQLKTTELFSSPADLTSNYGGIIHVL
jgi:DNA-binding transcriptional LysR family regulator